MSDRTWPGLQLGNAERQALDQWYDRSQRLAMDLSTAEARLKELSRAVYEYLVDEHERRAQ